MKVRDISLTCVALSVGCASAPAVSSAPRPEPAIEEDAATESEVEPSVLYPADTFGVVWRDADFYRDVDDPEPLRVFDFGDRPRSSRPGEGFTVRLLERRGDWHRVGTVTRWVEENRHVHCVFGGVVGSTDLELVFWVRARDLMPVLRRSVERRFDDGGHVVMEAGTPVVDGRPWMRGYWLPVDVDADDVGVGYVPQRTPARDALADKDLFFALLPDPKLGFDGHSAPWTDSVDFEPTLHRFRERDGAKFLVWDSCGVAEFRAPDDVEPTAIVGGALGWLGGTVEEFPAGGIEAGTRLYWPGGAPAGVAVQDTVRPDLLPRDEPMTCIQLPLGYGTAKGQGFLHSRATVCVETNQIHRTTYVGSWNDEARRSEEAPDLFQATPPGA